MLRKSGDSNGKGQPEGWVWRGLAFMRLGDYDSATRAFDTAENEGLAPLPQTRTWREWDTIVKVYAIAGLWKKVFQAAKKPPSQDARFRLQLLSLELYEKLVQTK